LRSEILPPVSTNLEDSPTLASLSERKSLDLACQSTFSDSFLNDHHARFGSRTNSRAAEPKSIRKLAAGLIVTKQSVEVRYHFGLNMETFSPSVN